MSLVADDSSAEPLRNLPFTPTGWAQRHLYVDAPAELLFTDNETNAPRVLGPWAHEHAAWVKDAFHRHVVDGEHDRLQPGARGHEGVRAPAGDGAGRASRVDLPPAADAGRARASRSRTWTT